MNENENQNEQQEQEEQQQEERTFTQAEVDQLINKRLARERRNQPSEQEWQEFQEYQKAHKPKDQATQLQDITTERDSYQTELEMTRRENFLLKQGVDADDVDYFVYKITKSMGDDDDFEDAAKKFLKDHKPRSGVRVDMGARLSGGTKPKSDNQTMNDLIRGARN